MFNLAHFLCIDYRKPYVNIHPKNAVPATIGVKIDGLLVYGFPEDGSTRIAQQSGSAFSGILQYF